jgi:hypothetical protein
VFFCGGGDEGVEKVVDLVLLVVGKGCVVVWIRGVVHLC